MKVNIEKLQEFHKKLEKISTAADGKNKNTMSLTEREQGVKIAREYYTYLEASGEIYGKAALLVINDEGWGGKTANIHLRTQAVFDGVKKEYLPELQDRIKISLAFVDNSKRIEEKENFNTQVISDYHKAIFKSQGVSEYAWGGLFMEELLGPGKWMSIVDSDVKKFDQMREQLSKIKNNESDYALERLISSAKHSFTCYTTVEHDYSPSISANNSKEVAIRYGVDESRIKEYCTDTMDLQPMDLIFIDPRTLPKIYKISPKSEAEGASNVINDKFYSELANAYVNSLKGHADKIMQGTILTRKESTAAKITAIDYFNFIKPFNSPDIDFHLNLIKGLGPVGNVSNSILFRQAAIDGVRDIEAKADNMKILLASSHAKAVSGSSDGKIPLEKSNMLREDAFKSQGLSPYSDMGQVIDAISSHGKCYNVSQLSDIGCILQNVISLPSSSPQNIGLNNVINLPEKVAGISAFRGVNTLKDGLSAYINPKSTVTIGPVIGANREEIARDFGIKPEQVKPKFSEAQNSALPRDSNIDKIFEIIPPQEVNKTQSRSILFREIPKSFSPNLNALEKFDPEFLIKLMVSPLASKPQGPSLNAFSLKPKPINSEAVDNSKLQISVNKNFSEIHKTKNMGMSWVEGVAMYGPQYEVRMPADVLNGNGAKNVWPSSIVTDSYRPGAHQISDFNTPQQIKSIVHNSSKIGPVKVAAMINNCQTSSLSKLNIDPIVIDLTGNGLNFTSYKENKVLFDIDGDGFLEETGWVGLDTGILVVDKKGNGVISNIQEIISEKFEGIDAMDGFEALRRYDVNNDGIIDEHDPIFKTLRVWINRDLDGITKPGELFKLSDLGITAIIVAQNEITECNEIKADNLVKAKSYCLLSNGEKREVASVDFIANPSGHKYEETPEGIIVTSESGTKSYTSKGKNNKKLEAEKLAVNNIYSNEEGGDILVGNDKDNWLVSRGGSNTYIGKKGDNTLVITAEDKLENIQAGEGFNTVVITGNKGMYFDLKKTGAHVLNGSNSGDFIDASECNYNTFIQAGDGDNVIIGGRTDSALSGGRGNDIIVAGSANSIIRGHNGSNILIGGSNNNYIESGDGFNLLIGGSETNIFTANNSGYAIFDGSSSKHNIVKFSGEHQDYSFTRTKNGDLIVKDLRPNIKSVSILKNVHEMKFSDISGVTEYSIMHAISIVPIEERPKEIKISCDQLIANHSLITKIPIFVSQVNDIKGGEVKIEYHHGNKVKNITFLPDHLYQGVMSFTYVAIDEDENEDKILLHTTDEFNGSSSSIKSRVFLKKPSYPEDKLFYMQYYLSENNIFPLWENYTGKGVKVAVVEIGTFNPDHPDLKPNSLLTQANPDAFDNHANMVAGVIGAAITGSGPVGVAPEVSLMSRTFLLNIHDKGTPVVPSADIINLSSQWVFQQKNPNINLSFA